MTWRDKLELGLKEDAAYRKDNLPPGQIRGQRSRSTAQASQDRSSAARSSEAHGVVRNRET